MTTNNFPDFTNYGYQVNRELGHNRAGGRVTYLATEINSQRSVVVKQFQFSRTGSDWREYGAYEKEIQVLQTLESPNIPRYLDSFQTPGGFCMVQEYKNAASLADSRTWKPQEVKQIALSVLEILKYLQSRIPPVIHRDLKPDNILVDDQMNVYLVDFGFARTGGGEVTVSSVVKGTLGFMPPEQMFNREITIASDLYSLGATLICLLSGTNANDVGSLMDDTGRINFPKLKKRLPPLNSAFLNWLEKMVNPNYKYRYENAETALTALIPLEVLPPFEMPKWVWPTVAGVTAGTVILGMTVTGVVKLLKPAPENQIAVSKSINPAVTITADPESSESLEQISMSDKRVYFSVSLSEIKTGEYTGFCQLFDGVGALVAMGEAPVKAADNGLQAWCWYDFNNPDEVEPGDWQFKFYLQGESVAETSLNVMR
jgi:serine/threonine protein kinase